MPGQGEQVAHCRRVPVCTTSTSGLDGYLMNNAGTGPQRAARRTRALLQREGFAAGRRRSRHHGRASRRRRCWEEGVTKKAEPLAAGRAGGRQVEVGSSAGRARARRKRLGGKDRAQPGRAAAAYGCIVQK